MSANIPESIPTSSDPRSKRAVKKRALTPTSAQAATLDSLFARPDQEIRLPPALLPGTGSAVARRTAIPEIVTNVQGSSAGAGSGEFHVYKASRRREYERLRVMDEEVRREQEREEFERERSEREARDEEKTRRNRERREKKKSRRGKGEGAKKEGGVVARSIPSSGGGEGRDEEMRNGDENGGGGGAQVGGVSATPVVANGPGLVIHDED